MKRIFALLAACAVALCTLPRGFAAEPDKPGTKLITIQGGYGPSMGVLLSGNIAMANLGPTHLYGGLQGGGYFRHGKVFNVDMTNLSLAPRVMLGLNLGRVVELHAGGFAGIAAQRLDDVQTRLVFSYGGFGGLRLQFTPSFGLILEGCVSPHLPYGLGGFAIKF
jgi:hypothetical protein